MTRACIRRFAAEPAVHGARHHPRREAIHAWLEFSVALRLRCIERSFASRPTVAVSPSRASTSPRSSAPARRTASSAHACATASRSSPSTVSSRRSATIRRSASGSARASSRTFSAVEVTSSSLHGTELVANGTRGVCHRRGRACGLAGLPSARGSHPLAASRNVGSHAAARKPTTSANSAGSCASIPCLRLHTAHFG